MFKNIGSKIKAVAKIFCFTGMLISLYYGLTVIIKEEIILGVLVLIVGSLGSWLGTIALYGFGQLVENSKRIIDILEEERDKGVTHVDNIPLSAAPISIKPTPINNNYSEEIRDDIVKKMIDGKINTLEKLLQEGVITEEEYKEKMAQLK